MGQFRVTVVAVGNHGCGRGVASGGLMEACLLPNCTDCITREYVQKLKDVGSSVSEASIHHWPASTVEVLDNLVTGTRIGQFFGVATT